jgi:hypothetical protein
MTAIGRTRTHPGRGQSYRERVGQFQDGIYTSAFGG